MTTEKDGRMAAFERALGLDEAAPETLASRAERERLEYRLAPLADLMGDVTPGDDLFARITRAIDAQGPLEGVHVMRSADGEWRPLCDGIDTKTLWRSEKSLRHAFLLRFQPGAVLQAHTHAGDEEILLLEGDMMVNGVSFGPGDFQVFLAGTRHPIVTSRAGCVCLLSVQLLAA